MSRGSSSGIKERGGSETNPPVHGELHEEVGEYLDEAVERVVQPDVARERSGVERQAVVDERSGEPSGKQADGVTEPIRFQLSPI